MPRVVHCVKLKREAEGLDAPPYPGQLGQRIYEQVSKDAWLSWVEHQKRLINEKRLNLADWQARQYVAEQMEDHFFGDSRIYSTAAAAWKLLWLRLRGARVPRDWTRLRGRFVDLTGLRTWAARLSWVTCAALAVAYLASG